MSKRSHRLFTAAFCAVSLAVLAGCASSDSNKTSTPANPDKERVSTLPWNRPASWEGQGSLGGMGLGGPGTRY